MTRGCGWLRHLVIGLDYLVMSIALLALAIAVSVGKSKSLRRRLAAWQEEMLGTPIVSPAVQEGGDPPMGM